MTITNDIRYIGVNDHDVDLFEGQYPVPKGIAYNSYVILDEKIAASSSVSWTLWNWASTPSPSSPPPWSTGPRSS